MDSAVILQAIYCEKESVVGVKRGWISLREFQRDAVRTPADTFHLEANQPSHAPDAVLRYDCQLYDSHNYLMVIKEVWWDVLK